MGAHLLDPGLERVTKFVVPLLHELAALGRDDQTAAPVHRSSTGNSGSLKSAGNYPPPNCALLPRTSSRTADQPQGMRDALCAAPDQRIDAHIGYGFRHLEDPRCPSRTARNRNRAIQDD